MSHNLIFRASDTATALEKVQHSLGPDAYIIDIKNVGQGVEITASRDEPIMRSPQTQVDPRKSLSLAKNKLSKLTSDDPTQTTPAPSDEINTSPKETPLTQVLADAPIKNVFSDEESLTEPASKAPLKDFDTTNVLRLTPNVEKEPVKTRAASSNQNKSPLVLENKYGFGDLRSFGLSNAFIGREFGLQEFDGTVTRDDLIDGLVSALFEATFAPQFDNLTHIAVFGPPGAGKSTLIAKLMAGNVEKSMPQPKIFQISSERVFEGDRLRSFSQTFNLPYSKTCNFSFDLNEHPRAITEIAWDLQIDAQEKLAHFGSLAPETGTFLVLPADINEGTLGELLRVLPSLKTIVLTKCDYGRFSMKNLMKLYESECMIAGFTGDTSIHDRFDPADQTTMRGFIEYTLAL